MSAPDYDKISRYIDGEMDAEELQAFEQLLLQDDELKKGMELYKEVNDTLKDRLHPGEEELALRDTMENLRSKYFSKETHSNQPVAKVIRFKRFRWAVAAAAALVIIAVIVWSPWNQPDLYRQYASTEMTSFAERGAPVETLQKEVTDKFNDKKFAETIPLFERLLKTDSANAFNQFYYAVALLETGQAEKSRTELIQLYNGGSVFKYDAAFYTALSYLKEKNKDACRDWLNKIPEGVSAYSKSQDLLKKL